MRYINSITEAIGNTPLLKLNRIGKEVPANIFVKLEYLNPSGSYKDRMALAMVEAAERGDTWNGRKLLPGGTVMDASAGNTAPALAMVCAAKGYHAKLVLYRYSIKPVGDARMNIVSAYGPEVAVSSAPECYLKEEDLEIFRAKQPDLPHVLAAKMDCALEEQKNPDAVWVDQIYNRYNYMGQMAMGREIYEQLDGQVDAIGTSLSSAASLYGMCLGLREHGLRPPMVFGAVPKASEQYFSFTKDECDRGEFSMNTTMQELAKAMGLEKWVTEKPVLQLMLEDGYPDKLFCISDEEARAMANRLCQEEGLYCGMSSGANVAAALKIAARLQPGQNVVTTIVDRRDRYLSEYPNDKYVT